MSLFVRIVDKGSLTAAAADDDLSPTMVGNYLQALEQRLGMRLLNRTTRRQSLTEFGKRYYDRCVEILALVAETDALAIESQTAPAGCLRISVSNTFGLERFVPALADYVRIYPRVNLDVVLTDNAIGLLQDGIEAAIRIGNPRGSDLITRPLVHYRQVFCATPGYVSDHGKPSRPEDLASHDCIVYKYACDQDGYVVRSVWHMAGPSGDLAIPVTGRLELDSSQGVRSAVLAGMGIAMLPEIMVSEDIVSGRLIHLLCDYAPPERPLNLIYRRDRRMSIKLRSFIDFVLERFGAQPDAPLRSPLHEYGSTTHST